MWVTERCNPWPTSAASLLAASMLESEGCWQAWNAVNLHIKLCLRSMLHNDEEDGLCVVVGSTGLVGPEDGMASSCSWFMLMLFTWALRHSHEIEMEESARSLAEYVIIKICHAGMCNFDNFNHAILCFHPEKKVPAVSLIHFVSIGVKQP